MFPLHMGWRHALFANWPVDPDVVAAHVPDGLAVDTFDGRAWLSVVPFVNVDVRPTALPTGTGIPVPELNLRTYVTVAGEPAVYFFSLDAQSVLAVLGARLTHHLPYYYARIDLDADPDGGPDRAHSGGRPPSGEPVPAAEVTFESRRRHPGARPATFRATYTPTGREYTARRGTLAAFLTDRHRLYTEAWSGRLRYTDVFHEPWPLYDAAVDVSENTLFRADGFEPPDSEPVHFYSPAVDVVAAPSRTVAGADDLPPDSPERSMDASDRADPDRDRG